MTTEVIKRSLNTNLQFQQRTPIRRNEFRKSYRNILILQICLYYSLCYKKIGTSPACY